MYGSNQKREGHINLRKIAGTPAGCPRDTRRDKQGSTGRVSRGLPVVYYRKTDQKRAFLPGHRPGVPGTPGRPGGFQKSYVIFSYVPFLLPIQAVKVPICGGFPVENTTNKQPPQGSSKGDFSVRVRFRGVLSTVEEVLRVRFCRSLS